jgi:hypothetical protein
MSFGIPVRNGLGVGLLSSAAVSSRPTYALPTFGFNFLTGSLSPGVTFTRASSGTFVGSNGLIQTAAIDAARFTYSPTALTLQGLLIEPQRTNVLSYSEQFNDAYWTKTNSSVSADATTAPDGTLTADKIIENTANGNHDVRRASISAAGNTTYTQSIYVKASERTRGALLMLGGAGNCTVNFNLTAGTVSATVAGGWVSVLSSITDCGNGWYRIQNTATSNAGTTTILAGFFLADASGSTTYVGDGTSGIFYWGAQLEAGATASSYIPTTAGSAIRSADSAAFVIPATVTKLRYVFDNGSTQDVSVSSGAYTIPTNLNRPIIQAIVGLVR